MYRPLPSAENGMTTNVFLEDISNFFEQEIIDPKSIIILGNFTFHVDLPNDAAAVKFIDLLETFGLKQHIMLLPIKVAIL